jgi:hypothetical protein
MSFFTRTITRVKEWIQEDGITYLASCVIHMVLFLLLMLILGRVEPKAPEGEAPSFEASNEEVLPEPQLTQFEVGDAPLDPTELTTESLTLTDAPTITQEDVAADASDLMAGAGGGTLQGIGMGIGGVGGFDIKASGLGPMVRGSGGIGGGKGTGKSPGFGGSGYGGRSSGMRKAMLSSGGGTKGTERAVAAALSWLARHQNPDGSWSIDHRAKCKDPSCTGAGSSESDAGATALGLLPFLAAGQTHESKGPYRKTIYDGLNWLIKRQKPNGDLSAGGSQMYSHGLAAIALCEAYALSRDQKLAGPAQLAINFIDAAQDPQTGGWRYTFRQPGGDTSVFGWQVMALKSGMMAGLKVRPASLDLSRRWLSSVGQGSNKGLFSYTPVDESGAPGKGTPSMTAVGLLISQYLGMARKDPAMVEGTRYLMSSLPKSESRNVYYWYYATQVMHNIPGPDWDQWNRQMRRVLIESQDKSDKCAAGSWDPLQPHKDQWGEQGGRMMVTSLAALSLEVYYRYLPLYQEMGSDENPLAQLELLEPGGGSKAKVASDEKKADSGKKEAAEGDQKPAAEEHSADEAAKDAAKEAPAAGDGEQAEKAEKADEKAADEGEADDEPPAPAEKS